MSISRRTAIAHVGAALAAPGALALSTIETPAVQPPARSDSDLEKLTGLSLAAVHIERAVEAMGGVTFGNWSVKIYSGQPDQNWAFHQERNAVRAAISLHQQASDAVDEAIDKKEEAFARMMASPRYESRPSVQVGKYIAMGDLPERPIYAYTVDEIERHSEKWQAAGTSVYSVEAAEAYRAKFAKLREDLERRLRRKKGIERRAGYTSADKALTAAWRAEEKAAMAVMLTKARDASEAAERRSYMRGKASFDVGGWDTDHLFDTVMSATERHRA
jgi:hypothetical protein